MPADIIPADVPLDLDAVLCSEMAQRAPLPWARLPKWEKVKALGVFTQEYSSSNDLDKDTAVALLRYLRKALDGRRLQCSRNVAYDKTARIITAIPGLSRSPSTGRFTLRSDGSDPPTPRSEKCA
jgi:hypothetical protein